MTTRGKTAVCGCALMAAAVALLVMAAPPVGTAAAGGKGFAYPQGQSGAIAEAYIRAFGSETDSLMVAFHESYLSEKGIAEASIKTRMWEYRRLHKMLGELIPHSVTEQSDSTLVLLVKSVKLDTWFELGLEMDADSAGMIVDVDLRPAARPK